MHLFSSSLGKPRLINIEYLAIEKEAYEKLIESIVSLKRRVNKMCLGDKEIEEISHAGFVYSILIKFSKLIMREIDLDDMITYSFTRIGNGSR